MVSATSKLGVDDEDIPGVGEEVDRSTVKGDRLPAKSRP